MCKCKPADGSTPFCGANGCEWPDDAEDCSDSIADFLNGARWLAQQGYMRFADYLALCIEFDPAQ